MGFYSRVLFPRCCDLLLDTPAVAGFRRELLANAQGRILEIGFGTGLNLACYPPEVQKLTVVEPNAGMHELARRRIKKADFEVEKHILGGERLPFTDGAFDCVVSTFTLCSIDDVSQALREAYRVLVPGGRFLFLEHGQSPEPGVMKWQKRLNWIQQTFGDGCRLDRNMRELVKAQPFASVMSEEFYWDAVPRTHGYLYRGQAIK